MIITLLTNGDDAFGGVSSQFVNSLKVTRNLEITSIAWGWCVTGYNEEYSLVAINYDSEKEAYKAIQEDIKEKGWDIDEEFSMQNFEKFEPQKYFYVKRLGESDFLIYKAQDEGEVLEKMVIDCIGNYTSETIDNALDVDFTIEEIDVS